MKCCSRSTWGVVIGILNIVGYVICVIGAIIMMVQLSHEKEIDNHEMSTAIFITLIVVCIIMTIISAFLIAGIVNRRHQMMLPWLILSGIAFVFNCLRFVYLVVASIIAGLHFPGILIMFLVGVLFIGISALILWPIYTLYRDMRRKNIQYQAPPDFYQA